MSKFSIIFPGQGSQSVGMLADLAVQFSVVQQTFAEASEALGLDLWKIAQQGPAEQLNRTQNTQPTMLTAGISVWRVWQAQGGAMPALLAGHSLGEYTALTASGVLSFVDAVQLVAERGRLMQSAVPVGEGAMAAILGLQDQQVRDVCEQAAQNGVAEAVNFNSPGQIVIAGSTEAINRAITLAKEAGAKRAVLLDVSVPSHCQLMRGAADQLYAVMDGIEIGEPTVPVVQNVNAAVAGDLAQIKDLLKQQLYSPVRWVESVQFMQQQGVESLLEAGPGKVLTGLTKRIDKSLNPLAIFDGASLEKALETVNG